MSASTDIAIAIITDASHRILVARRLPTASHLPDVFEFPGGKVRVGESPADACHRECREELGADVIVHDLLLPPTLHVYPDRTVRLHFFRCTLAAGSPAPRALAAAELRWVEAASLPHLAWPDANRAVVALLAASPPPR